MEKDPKNPHHIDDLKYRIYSKSYKAGPRKRRGLHNIPHNVSDKWKEEDVQKIIKKKPTKSLLASSMFKKVFIGAIIFFILSVGFGAYMFFGESNTVSANNIEISILGNAFVNGGEDLPLQVQILNRNNVDLQYVDLRVEYQKGAGQGENMFRQRIGLGTISAGSLTKEIVDVVVFGQQGSTRDINFSLEYRVPGSNAIFVKDKLYTINISSAPVNLAVSGPSTSGTNQNISFTVKTGLNTSNAVKNMMIRVDYPRGFEFRSASPSPAFGDNIWTLGDLNPGVEREIKIEGVIIAQPGEQRAFNVFVGQQIDVNERQMGVQFNSQSYVVAIQRPLLDTRMAISGDSSAEVFVRPNSSVGVQIQWQNSTNQKINDIEIVADVQGSVVNHSSIQTSGFYEATTRKIIWNRQNYPAFASTNPGQSGTLSLSFQTLAPSSGDEVIVSLSIRARDPSNINQFVDIKNFDRKIVKFSTNLQMTGHALHRSGVFTNTGPLPPTPGQATTYTISLSMVNTLNDVSGAEVRGRLPIYVDYTGLSSPSNESFVFNQTTKEFVWRPGTIRKSTGIDLPAREVQFQVRFNPSTTHIGKMMPLVELITFKGVDTNNGAQISGNFPSITTEIRNDLNYNKDNDKVQ